MDSLCFRRLKEHESKIQELCVLPVLLSFYIRWLHWNNKFMFVIITWDDLYFVVLLVLYEKVLCTRSTDENSHPCVQSWFYTFLQYSIPLLVQWRRNTQLLTQCLLLLILLSWMTVVRSQLTGLNKPLGLTRLRITACVSNHSSQVNSEILVLLLTCVIVLGDPARSSSNIYWFPCK